MQKNASNEIVYPIIIGSFILQYSRQVMNKFIQCIDGFNQKKVYYTDTDSIYIKIKDYKILVEMGYVGENSGQGKNDVNEVYKLSCEEYNKYIDLNKDCDKIKCDLKCKDKHIYKTDNEIYKAYFLGPKQKYVLT